MHVAFEGLAHPYKENIVKFGNQSVLGNLPEVQEALKEVKEAKTEPKASA
jgi:large subunit ribosomal protein L13